MQSNHPTHSPSSQVRTMYILTNLITSLTVITGYFGEYVSFKETLLQFSILLTQLYLLHLTVLHFESCRQVWFELLQRGSKPRPFLALSFGKLDLKEGSISSKIRGHVWHPFFILQILFIKGPGIVPRFPRYISLHFGQFSIFEYIHTVYTVICSVKHMYP